LSIYDHIYRGVWFEWDLQKDRLNKKKHLIGFREVRTIFDGSVLTVVDNRIDYGEERFLSIGEIKVEDENVVIVVAHTRRGDRTRIISARRASRKERSRHHDYIRRQAT
jgi:uncharacterized DUF497 family protein